MKTGRFSRGAAVAVGTWLAWGAALADESRRSFVSCPMVRDTQSVPCWLAEYEGELYFLTLQTDVSAPVTPPWLGHKVLVEGKAAPDEPRICGGIVIKDVRLSVLPEIDTSCNTILPAEERYNLTFEPPRPPGPSGGRLAFDGARQGPPAAQRPDAASSTAVREFTVPYTFDGMVGFGHPRFLTPVIRHAVEVKARQIEIIGYRGAALLDHGETLVEAAGIGRRRAQQIATIMKGSDLESPEFKVSWVDEPAAVTGENDHLTRRVVIKVHAP